MTAVMVIGCRLLSSCAVDDNPVVGPDNPEVKNYSERLVPVVDPKGASQGTVMLRFYNDMPNVAYVSISNFQQMMYPGTTVQVVPTGEHQYALTSPCGTATVDTDKDIFESDDYEAFTNIMGQVQPGMSNTAYDALPIIRWKSTDVQPKNVHVALDYGIPLLGKQSGGGSCCVLYNPSTDGFGYCYSTHRGRLINHKGENIDAGIKPDYELETADFFNIQKVTQLIESYYK